MKKIISISLVLVSILLFNSCKKVEGQGGGSTIKGIIYEQKYSLVGTLVAEYPAVEKDVYIIYGSGNTFYNDRIKTSYDGSFEFNYLEEGDYTVFVYEDSNTEPSGTNTVIVTTKISVKKSTVDLGTINTKKL
ncbi:MAG: hypothetical protein RI883_197 [Bacteroidota bacterium]|jgi:hypothetical protein